MIEEVLLAVWSLAVAGAIAPMAIESINDCRSMSACSEEDDDEEQVALRPTRAPGEAIREPRLELEAASVCDSNKYEAPGKEGFIHTLNSAAEESCGCDLIHKATPAEPIVIRGERGADGPRGPKGDRGDDVLSPRLRLWLEQHSEVIEAYLEYMYVPGVAELMSLPRSAAMPPTGADLPAGVIAVLEAKHKSLD